MIDIEKERKTFESHFKLDISNEWDSDDKFYDSDVGELVVCLWNGWIARAELDRTLN